MKRLQTGTAELDALLSTILPATLRIAATGDRAFIRPHPISARREGAL